MIGSTQFDFNHLSMCTQVSDPKSLHAAVEDILERLHGAVKPVLIAGKTRAHVSQSYSQVRFFIYQFVIIDSTHIK